MVDWVDTERGRGRRERRAAQPVPDKLPLLPPEQYALLLRWASEDDEKRRRATLLSKARGESIEDAEALCSRLLTEGWIVRHERLLGGHWQWEAILWRDLSRLQSLLGVSSPRQRKVQREQWLGQAQTWLRARSADSTAATLDPDLLDELKDALAQLTTDNGARPEVLQARLELLRALAAWFDGGFQGSRRDFALHARGNTKSLGEADWHWLEALFDLERLRIMRFAPVAWLAGDLRLQWQGRGVDLWPLHCLGVPLADLVAADAATGPQRWWLIENRASFERQAHQRVHGLALLWLPGRPSPAWLAGAASLLALAPAPAWISADIDPAGVDIACTVATLWKDRNLTWEPHRMDVERLQTTSQRWPLNDHDRALLQRLLGRSDLAPALRELCEAMKREGRKAEQEAWL